MATRTDLRTQRVLLVDDQEDDRALAARLLRADLPELEITEAPDAAAFAEALARGDADLVVTEHRLAWSDAPALVGAVRRAKPETPVLLWTAEADPALIARVLRLGAAGFVPKTSGGFLDLAAVVAQLLGRPAAATTPTPEPRRPETDADLFTHAASHDLQEPAQLVVRYARRIGERLAGRLSAGERSDLEHLVTSAEHLQTLLDGLLEVSRLSSPDRAASPVDLGEVVDEAAASLRESLEATGGEVTHGPLPRLVAGRAQMLELFQNLIGNALKFHGAEPPRVHVSAREEDGRWTIAVEDNGIGIDPEDQERIFQMFQRVHPESSYPGRGIGLALCRRIAEHHGGTLRVDSRPGRGATFSLVLPSHEGPGRPEAGARPRIVDAGGS